MTGLSRVAGLGREVLASGYFGTSGGFSAFTVAFQIPNLVRRFMADSALSASFVPIFTELLEQGRRREAFQLAATLVWSIALILSAVAALFILFAGSIVPLLLGPAFGPSLVHLTVGLAQVLFPTVVLLGVNGIIVAISQVHGRFGWTSFAAVAWNAATVAGLVVLLPYFQGSERLYAYALGTLLGTVVQLAIAVAVLRRIDVRLTFKIDWRDKRIRRMLTLALPVTIALGIVDVDSLSNATLGTLLSSETPRAIDAAFRVYMVPQGLFAIPLTTVMFPTMGRLAAKRDMHGLRTLVDTGLRRLTFFTIPASALMIALATPIVRVIYQRGAFTSHSTALVAQALVWFAVSLPFAACNILLTRTYFVLQRAWLAGRLAAVNIAVDLAVSAILYRPLGISGLVIGTAIASAAMLAMQLRRLTRELKVGEYEDGTAGNILRMVIAGALLGLVSWQLSAVLQEYWGDSLIATALTLAIASCAGIGTYLAAVTVMRVPEARHVRTMLGERT